MGGQVALVNTTSRHLRWFATASIAGNHCAACESPNNTIVVFESVCPNWQRLTVESVNELSHPSRNGAALSSAAPRKLGSRFDGTSRVWAALAMAFESGRSIASTRAVHLLFARSESAVAVNRDATSDGPPPLSAGTVAAVTTAAIDRGRGEGSAECE